MSIGECEHQWGHHGSGGPCKICEDNNRGKVMSGEIFSKCQKHHVVFPKGAHCPDCEADAENHLESIFEMVDAIANVKPLGEIMSSMYDDVGRFHQKFNLPNEASGPPRMLTRNDFEYRLMFLREELNEFITAHNTGDIAGAADALADLAWVALGTAHYMHLPLNEVWGEVRRANMDKTLASEDDAEHKRGRVERIRKPLGWVPPRIAEILRRY